jgi:hypothetical protein
MHFNLQKTFVAMLTLALLFPLLSFTASKISPIDPKIAKAEAIARVENVEDMDITPNQSLVGNANTQNLKTITSKNDVFVNGETLVKFKTLEDKNSYAQEKGANYNPAATSKLFKLKVGSNYDMKMTEDAILSLKVDSRVEYAEPNYIGHSNTVVNDTYYNKQWFLKNNADFTTNSKTGYDINIEEAWQITKGSPDTLIALIDSAVDFPNSPEIADSILRDTNGKVIGKNIALNCDYTDSTGHLNTSCPTNDSGADHATTQAGLITAKTNENNGVAGICPNCKIMPLGILNQTTEQQTTASMINAISFAILNNADIISSSVGFKAPIQNLSALNNATQNAINAGIFFVAATGNCGESLSPENLAANNCKVGSKQTTQFPICTSNTSTVNEKYLNGCIASNIDQYPPSFDNVISVTGYDSTGLNETLSANDKVEYLTQFYFSHNLASLVVAVGEFYVVQRRSGC